MLIPDEALSLYHAPFLPSERTKKPISIIPILQASFISR